MAGPEFLALDEVEYGRVDQVSPQIRRVIAENPSKFTYRGTGTYLVGRGDVVVIDPGPRLESHRRALEQALDGERVRAILVTHCHADHSPLSTWLRDVSGAPTIAFGPHPRPDPAVVADVPADELEPASDAGDRADAGAPAGVVIEESTDHDFRPTDAVVDGDVVVSGRGLTITAVHTPGHTSNHTCWAFAEEETLFTGDHVMGWSTTVVSPPDGDMAAYFASLRGVADRDDRVLWPTHGPCRTDGRRYVESLLVHREEREAAIVRALAAGPTTVPAIVEVLYADVRRELHKPARRSVWAHLVKLVAEGRAAVEAGGPARLTSVYTAV
ncbi:MAG: MBL fold metallo-hydrolase [Ilumatobacter sp.]|uniref:MBL fold metallo-hydrolase n=1 Tax=Ilumatobacter sp. TaxID=1967498 RepID=UPI0026258849|nr:MBL fold metallo-hydrolase [Ilumatobacter sp.]MDJ0767982.1 MBL fold metallo-hydrolase [Ilumatobacter sp.]